MKLHFLAAALFVVSAMPAQAPATVHFYGDGYFGTRHVPIYVDGKEVGKIHGRNVLDITVTAGKHEIRSGDKKSGIVLDAKESGESYVKVALGGSLVLHGQVTLVDPAQGEYEVRARREKHLEYAGAEQP